MRTEANLLGLATDELLALIANFTPDELNEVPFPGSWTAGQVGDHLYRSYAVIRTLTGNVVPTTRPIDEKISMIRDIFLDFNIKMESPVGILPSTGFIDKDLLLHGIKERTSRFKELIYNEDLSLICTDYAIPEYGPFTRLEWLYFTIFHTKRHLNQLQEIKEKVIAV